MRTGFLASLLLFSTALATSAALIRPQRMEWYTAVSRDVVLCEEQSVEIRKIAHHPPESTQNWTEVRTLVTCKVLRVFKGNLQPGVLLNVDYDMIFCRVFLGGNGYTQLDPAGKVLRVVQPQYLPTGRAMLFLTKKLDKPTYDVVTAKLIQQGKVYQYLQAMDPGPLELMPQQPENFPAPSGLKHDTPETEGDLVNDELIAVQKAALIK